VSVHHTATMHVATRFYRTKNVLCVSVRASCDCRATMARRFWMTPSILGNFLNVDPDHVPKCTKCVRAETEAKAPTKGGMWKCPALVWWVRDTNHRAGLPDDYETAVRILKGGP